MAFVVFGAFDKFCTHDAVSNDVIFKKKTNCGRDRLHFPGEVTRQLEVIF